MPKQENCRILQHQQIASTVFKLTLSSPNLCQEAKPGQFVNIRVSSKYDPLLRRPLSLHRIIKKDNAFQLLYEVVGKGTAILSQTKPGDDLDILGPLGSGFSLPSEKQTIILVGGGMGVAPLVNLAEKIKDQRPKTKDQIIAFIGAGTKAKLYCEKDFKQIADKVLISTDDGSHGEKGFVSDLLYSRLTIHDSRPASIYACGPYAMLEAISNIARKNKIPCQVSMEAKMACGIGTCMGCVIKTKNGYKKVCDDGPVFDAAEIIWD
ncbi:MAG: dihydroorotate dehydrogenase electron transfer subunit [Candidatus Margulisbacteria bacterium]|nr:dihydroorotate dehydrogenase electron transfer subunit [Candidatus Margulisiibacteriota bacterium]